MTETKLKQKVDFTGKNIFVGIDAHKKNWSISLFYEQEYLRTFTQPGICEALVSFLKREFPNANFLCGYETGFCGFDIQRKLEAQGIKCLVLHAADIPQTGKSKIHKYDKGDSKRIGLSLATNMYNAVYIPEINDECDRSLVRYRFTIQKDLARCKNRIKSLLLLFGIDVPEQYENSWSKGFTKWLKECDKVKGSARIRLKLMIDQLETLRGVYLDTNREVRKLQISPKFEKPMDILTSVPGIGPLTAIAFMTEVIDIKRFSSMKKLNAFVGYIPMEYSSGEYEHKGKMTIRKNTLLRSLLVEAAWVAIKRDPALALIYNDLKKKMSGKRAIIKIARKLLCRIRYLLLNEIKYEKGILN